MSGHPSSEINLNRYHGTQESAYVQQQVFLVDCALLIAASCRACRLWGRKWLVTLAIAYVCWCVLYNYIVFVCYIDSIQTYTVILPYIVNRQQKEHCELRLLLVCPLIYTLHISF